MPKRSKIRHDDRALKTRFGGIVKSYRQRLGLSQEELAWRADIHRTYLADIERGGRNISLVNIVRLVSALEVTLAEFFYALEEYFQSPVEPGHPRRAIKTRGATTPRRGRGRQPRAVVTRRG